MGSWYLHKLKQALFKLHSVGFDAATFSLATETADEVTLGTLVASMEAQGPELCALRASALHCDVHDEEVGEAAADKIIFPCTAADSGSPSDWDVMPDSVDSDASSSDFNEDNGSSANDNVHIVRKQEIQPHQEICVRRTHPKWLPLTCVPLTSSQPTEHMEQALQVSCEKN